MSTRNPFFVLISKPPHYIIYEPLEKILIYIFQLAQYMVCGILFIIEKKRG